MEILVFKTNLTNIRSINNAGVYLNSNPHVLRWNVDLQDCDNVLRIETELLRAADVEGIINRAGYYCEELP